METLALGFLLRIYWHAYRALPVTLHLARDHRFHWTGIYGVQLGPWFIGAIRGSAAPEQVAQEVHHGQ